MNWALAAVLTAVIHGAQPAPEFLSTRGRDIVNESGETVAMRGINLGSWLMMETWIPSLALSWEAHLQRLAAETGIADEFKAALKDTGRFNDDTMTIEGYLDRLRDNLAKRVGADKAEAFGQKLEQEPPIVDALTLDRVWRQRFGDAGAQELWDAFHSVWMTEKEFRWAKELGFNFVRIPLWYRWFEDDAKPYAYKDYGFEWLDKALGWARANGLYVLIDLHGAVGGQNPWEHSGELSRGELFRNEEFQKRTYALWKAIAERYKDEPVVFAYGCLNEPYSAKGLDDWARVHDGIYDAIRSVDSKHIVMMEDGYKLEDRPWRDTGFFPLPKEMGWENVLYSFHFYHTGSLESHKKNAERVVARGKREQDRCDVPMYIGEFNSIKDDPGSIEAMGVYARAFDREGWAWSPWTLKYTGGGEEGKTLWGVYQYRGEWNAPDVHRDTKEVLLQKIALLAADQYAPHEAYAKVLREVLAPLAP